MRITTSLTTIAFLEENRFEKNPDLQARLIAIMFCRPESRLMQSEIIPSLHYFHFRSGGKTTFYFGGFEADIDDITEQDEACRVTVENTGSARTTITNLAGNVAAAGYTTVQGPDLRTWYFSPSSFDRFRRDVEWQTRWRYSGGCDMLLLNSRRDRLLDFSTSMVLQLDRVEELAGTPTVGHLFEAIFQYAEDQDQHNPTWGLSDQLGLRTARRGLWDVLLSLLPEALRSSANAARQLVVQDVSLATP